MNHFDTPHSIDQSHCPIDIQWTAHQTAQATRLLDSHLTPLLQRLVVFINLHHQLNNDHEMEIERLRQVKQLLVSVRDELQNVYDAVEKQSCSRDDEAVELSSKAVTLKLVHQLNGMAVPLLNLLQAPDETPSYIMRSATYAVAEEAALSLMKLWNYVQIIQEPNCIDSLALPILVSCAVTLSSLEISCDDSDKIAAEEKKTNQIEFGALDRGEECALAILRLIRCLFDNIGQNNDTSVDDELDSASRIQQSYKSAFALTLCNKVGNAMSGSLVARLVLSCLSVLTQDNSSVISKDNPAVMYKPKEKSVKLQLESLTTLQVLITSIELPELWQSVVPGCFASLYRSILTNLRYKSAASAHKVAAASIKVMSLLLGQSLLDTTPETTKSTENNSKSVMASLMAAVNQSKMTSDVLNTTNSSPSATLPQSNEKTTAFVNEVNNRLPGPLSILLGIIPVNRSRLVRKSGLGLCRVILVDAWNIWQQDNVDSIGRKAFEYCLTLLGDDDVELQKLSNQLLKYHKLLIGLESWRLRCSKSIVPILLELIEALPAFAKSGRDCEVCSHLRLINGYLLVSFPCLDGDADTWITLRGRKSDVGSALACSEAINVIKKSFGVLFTPDVSTISVKPVIENGLVMQSSQTEIESRSFRFLHLQDDTIEMARHTVHLIASALGAKRSALVIDGCFADIFQSCIKSVTQKDDDFIPIDRTSMSLDWSGSCIFANEILAGVSRLDRFETDSGSSGRDQRILISLASAVLPVIVSQPLWTLPTSLPDESPTVRPEKSMCEISYSSDAMDSNSVLMCALMEFINTFAKCLREDMRLNMPTILLPLLERVSTLGNHSAVQARAYETIYNVALSSGYTDTISLLKDNFDHIMDTISLRLRRHSKDRTDAPRSLMGVIDVLLRCVVHGEILDPDHVPFIAHLLDCVLHHFDRLNSANNKAQIQSFDTIFVFQSIVTFMATSINFQIQSSNQCIQIEPERENCEEKRLHSTLDGTSCKNSEGENPFSIESIRNEAADDDIESQSNMIEEGGANNKAKRFGKEISSINEILKRCTYLICHPDLRMQVLCINTMSAGFQSLGRIGAYSRALEGESASNPLLPAIAEYWPSIFARLKETSSKLHSKKLMSRSELSIRHMMATDQDKSPSDVVLIVLLSKLLGVASDLCTLSDGFFAGRFENDVYPILATILGDQIPSEMNKTSRLETHTKQSPLNPILQCLECVFKSSCKDALAGLISSCGTIILPLLAHRCHIGDKVVGVLKAMIQVDCDILWQQIQKLSGESVNQLEDPKKELCNKTCQIVSNKPGVQSKNVCSTIMVRRAKVLLEFMKQLREQKLHTSNSYNEK